MTPKQTDRLQEAGTANRLMPPQCWRTGESHLEALIGNPWYQHLASVAAAVHSATVRFFESEGLSNISVPVTTTSVSSPMGLGSDSQPVQTEISGNKVYLADSLQFLLELGLRISDRPQYYISNSFRGESVDSTHLSEFSHSEVEIFGGLNDVMGLAERYIKYLAQSLCSEEAEMITRVAGSVEHLSSVGARTSGFERISFADAQKMLGDVLGAFEDVAPGIPTITRAGEHLLIERLGGPVWLTHMPTMACPFYQRPVGDGAYCASADLLLGPGEILGSGARCIDASEVNASLAQHQVSAENYDWYVAMKEMTPLETAGFGLGLERFYMWVLQADDIRDCTLWIRKNGEIVGP